MLLARTPLLGPSPHAVDFVISGRHVAALFGLEPADDRAYVYGSLRLEEEGLGGRLRLDALTREERQIIADGCLINFYKH